MAAQQDVLNYVGNQPEVLEKLLPGFEGFDYSSFFDHPGNLMYGDEAGVILFFDKGDGVYELHYMLTARLRGRAALHFVQKCLHDVFTRHAAYAIFGATPRENRAARAMNRALGGRPTGVVTDSLGRPCIVYLLERSQWVTFLDRCSVRERLISPGRKPLKPH